MIWSRRCVVWTLKYSALAMSLLAAAPRASFGQNPADDDNSVKVKPLGMEIFRFALFKQNIEPLTGTAQVLENPSNSIIILMGEESIRSFVNQEIQEAVRSGASLLIASDRSPSDAFLQRTRLSQPLWRLS